MGIYHTLSFFERYDKQKEERQTLHYGVRGGNGVLQVIPRVADAENRRREEVEPLDDFAALDFGALPEVQPREEPIPNRSSRSLIFLCQINQANGFTTIVIFYYKSGISLTGYARKKRMKH